MHAPKRYIRSYILFFIIFLSASGYSQEEKIKTIDKFNFVKIGAGYVDHSIEIINDGKVVSSSFIRRYVNSFYVLNCEISQSLWDRYSSVNYQKYFNDRYDGKYLKSKISLGSDYPAVDMPYGKIIEYCSKLTLYAIESGFIDENEVIRLPTLLEWHYLMGVINVSERRKDEVQYNRFSAKPDGEYLVKVRSSSASISDIEGVLNDGNAFEWCLDALPVSQLHFDTALNKYGYVPRGSEFDAELEIEGEVCQYAIIVGRNQWNKNRNDIGRAQVFDEVASTTCVGFRLVIANKLEQKRSKD